MKVLLGFLLFVSAVGLIAYDHYNISYWKTPPATRAAQKWQREIDTITAKSAKIKTAFQLLKTIEQTTTDQQFKDMIDSTRSPFKTVKNGTYTLKLQYMPWIEEMKYGYLIQHELFDTANNKVIEFNTNIEIGKLW